VGLEACELDSRYPAQVVSTGLPFLIVPLRRPEGLAQITPNWKLLQPLVQKLEAQFPYYLLTGGPEIEVRMITPDFEDAATGSGGGCAPPYRVRYGIRPPDRTFSIQQGRFVHRPSHIFATASRDGDRVHRVRVGGYVVEVVKGRLTL